YLSGHKNPDNVIEQIVTQADAASVAQNLGADKEGINLAAEQARAVTFSLAGQLKLTLSHLLQSAEIPLNKKGAEGFVDGDHLYLMSKPIADRLRSTLLKYGNTSVPSDNSRLFNELQQHQLIRPNADDLAIWKCEVWLSEFDWRQTFTFICVHWPTLAPEAGLESLVGHIVPISEDAAEAPSQVSSSQGEDTSRADAPPPETSNDNETLSDDLMAFAIAKAASQAAPEAEEQNTLAHVGTQSAAPVDTVEAELEALKAASTAESSEPHTLLQKIDLRETQGEDLGHAFYEWLDSVLKGGVHPVNRQDALFHRLEQGLFVVSPGAFRTFIDERCQYAKTNSYSEVQQGLQPLNRHILTKDARNVHKVRIQDSNQALNGFLFPLTEEWETRYAVNPFVMLEGV
uniref:conjugal transfer nickase/helicase domain-containing protein n=1 Tax=uncultured Vibrio sp. TaxID=114054 RepID=UPI0026103AFF